MSNFKGLINEYLQKTWKTDTHDTNVYSTTESNEGLDHAPMWVLSVTLTLPNGQEYRGMGSAPRRKDAEARACETICDFLGLDD